MGEIHYNQYHDRLRAGMTHVGRMRLRGNVRSTPKEKMAIDLDDQFRSKAVNLNIVKINRVELQYFENNHP